MDHCRTGSTCTNSLSQISQVASGVHVDTRTEYIEEIAEYMNNLEVRLLTHILDVLTLAYRRI
jgi:hypothetical protein